jgi:tetratricopeptide (TPR) repeat protein
MIKSSQLSRAALVVAALALLAGIPAVLTAAQIRTPWVLASATAVAAVVVVFGAVWRDRYQRQAQQRDEQAMEIQDGCLMISGRLPKVSQVSDPLHLGVHRASMAAPSADGELPAVTSKVPVYVPRDTDDQLRELLARGGFILLVGDATAGKTRTAYEAMLATLPGHTLIAPYDREALPSAVAKAAETKQCVLWLDDLERYLGSSSMTRTKITGLISGSGQHKVILATLRAAEEARYTSDITGPEAARHTYRAAREVLELADRLRLQRFFSSSEQERAVARNWDPRIADAITHAGVYGIAEYLAAGPELLRDWENAWTPNTDPELPANPRGAAIVAAAVDIRRAGWSTPVPVKLLDEVHEEYLLMEGGNRLQPEPLPIAWDWACRPRRATTALLQREGDHRVQVFDYLVDVRQRSASPSDHVPERVIRAAVDFANPEESDSLGAVAYLQGRYGLAEYAYRHAYEARSLRPDLGANHVDTLNSRNNSALALKALGRLTEAEAEHRAVCHALEQIVGPEDPRTLTCRGDLARVYRALGRLPEAEAEHRTVTSILERVLGPRHPDTLASRGDLGRVLQAMGLLEQAEAEHRGVLDIRRQLLGHDHPSTLASRGSRASVLHDLGRLDEAEAEHRAVLEIRDRMLGPEHPRTLTSRGDLARVLRDLGRLEEAEAEQRGVLDIRYRVLGAEHHRTLASRGILASVLQDLGRLEEAEAEHRAVLDIRTRILGAEHPRTLTSRADLARVMQAQNRPEEAEAQHRAVLEIRRRVLGAEHPDTLGSRYGLADALCDQGRFAEAEAEYRDVLRLRTKVLGPNHPVTLASRVGLARALEGLGGLNP